MAVYIEGQAEWAFSAVGRSGAHPPIPAGDVGYVPSRMGHTSKNTGNKPAGFLEIQGSYTPTCRSNQWLATAPPRTGQGHLNLDPQDPGAAQGEVPVVPG